MELLLEQASSYAKDIDDLILLITVLVGFWFILAEAVFFWFIVKFREREGVKALYMDGTNPAHKKWISWPHYLVLVCDVFIIVGAVKVWYHVKQEMPPADETVRVYAQQWAWSFHHAGRDGKFDTADDIRTGGGLPAAKGDGLFEPDDPNAGLHLQAGRTYHFELRALDVLHSFSIPVFRLKQDCIPGRVVTGWFRPEKPGVYDLQCAEMCGIAHGIMGARVFVETPEQHAAWLDRNSPVATIAAAAPPTAPAEAAPAAAAATTPAHP